jgi:hypothetical protein
MHGQPNHQEVTAVVSRTVRCHDSSRYIHGICHQFLGLIRIALRDTDFQFKESGNVFCLMGSFAIYWEKFKGQKLRDFLG